MYPLFTRLALAGSALSLSLAFASAVQAADIAGSAPRAPAALLEIYGGYSFLKGDLPELSEDEAEEADERLNNPVMGAFAAVSLPFSENMALQLDVRGNTLFSSNSEDRTDSDQQTGGLHTAVHISSSNDSNLFGVLGGIGRTMFHDTNSATFWFAGAEYQGYLEALTVYMQGGYLDSVQAETETSDTLTDAFFVRGVARLYASEHSRLSAELAYASGETDVFPGELKDATVLAWGARLDHQVSDWPANLFLAYSGANNRGGWAECKTDAYDHRVMVGFSFAFGGSSIKASDRQGVALDTPDFANWVAASEMNQGVCIQP